MNFKSPIDLTNGSTMGGKLLAITDEHYTKINLQTSGGAAVHYNNLTNVPTSFTPAAHNHDDRYYTETESDARYLGVNGKAADADKLDGIDSSGFLRKNARDDGYVWLRRNAGDSVLFLTQQGTGDVVRFYKGDVDGSLMSAIDNYGNFTGNAATASKWATSRTVSLTGYLSGNFTLDGSGNASGAIDVLAVKSRGNLTAESGTDRPAQVGLSMAQAYTNGYPTTYGNVVSLRGTGDSQLLLGWSGVDGAHADNYIRSKRDNATAPWSGWAKIWTDANFTPGDYLARSGGTMTGSITVPSTAGNIALGASNYDYYSPKSHNSASWMRNEAGRWVFQSGNQTDAWTYAMELSVPVTTSGTAENTAWFELGQRTANGGATGKYRGLRIAKFSSNAIVDGDLLAGVGIFTDKVQITKNVGTGVLYHQGQMELRNTDNGDVVLGFHRSGYTAAALVHSGDGFIVKNSTNTNARLEAGNMVATGTLSVTGAATLSSTMGVTGKTMIHGTQAAAISLAIGDSDTGFNWVSDGNFNIMANNASIASVSPTQLMMNKQLHMNNQSIVGANTISGQLGVFLKASDSWLRINEDSYYSSGIYLGSSIIRTDNTLQVGSSGSEFIANSVGVTIKNKVRLEYNATEGSLDFVFI